VKFFCEKKRETCFVMTKISGNDTFFSHHTSSTDVVILIANTYEGESESERERENHM
jgi:hypothetical protein